MNHRLTQIALTTLVCTSSAWATTWIVDDNGGAGVQFTDIPPAIAAAQPGDVLLVAAGNYSAFILDKGLTIIGYSEPSVQGLAEVVGVQAGQRAALIGLRPTALHVDGCAGSVVLQDLLRLHRGTITNSNDVRLRTVELYPGWDVAAANGEPALVIAGARVEVVESFAYGNTGTDCFGEPSAARGGAGITLGTSARVHVAISRVYGGHGGWCTLSGLQAMDGGPALRLDQPSEVVISGPDALVHGGDGGVNLLYTRCGYDGIGACAVEGVGNVWHSGATIEGGHTDQSLHCIGGYNEPAFCGPSAQVEQPLGPSLTIDGTPTPGAGFTLIVLGEPGANATLILGRGVQYTATAGNLIEQLVPRNRVIPLGPLDVTGAARHNFALPAQFPVGLLIGAQAEVTTAAGLQRTNSIPLVVR